MSAAAPTSLSDLVTQVDEEEPSPSVPETKESSSCFWRWFCCCFGSKQPPPPASAPLTRSQNNGRSTGHAAIPAAGVGHSLPDGLSGADTKEWQEWETQYGMPPPPHPLSRYLLAPNPPELRKRKCLVLDLDETLVHSSFKPIPNPDFVISIELEGVIHKVFVRKRPGVDAFLQHCGQRFEVVVFTASLAKYADPLLDILDKEKNVHARLFREACVQHYGNYVKDLTHLGRPLEHSVIIDNSPFSYMFQPDNAIPVTSWFNDRNDRELYTLMPILDKLAEPTVVDSAAFLHQHRSSFAQHT